MMTIGENLKTFRTERGLTLTALAAASGLTKGFISQVEAGRSSPSLASLRKLAAALDTQPAHLVADTTAASGVAYQDTQLRQEYRTSTVRTGTPAITSMASVGSTNYFACTLDAGSRLVLRGHDHGGSGTALAMVRSGSVHVRQAGTDLRLDEGDAGSWNAAGAYTIELSYGRRADFFLCLPESALAPTMESTASQERGPAFRIEADGPYRIIAMRAERRLIERP